MPSVGAITKTIRLNREDRAIVEELMLGENLSWSGAIHKLINGENKKSIVGGTPQGKDCKPRGKENQGNRQDLMDRAVERDIGEMCKASGITTHDFYRSVCELFNEGQLGVEGEKVKCVGKYNMGDFENVCYKLHTKPEEMLEKLTRSLERNV